MNSSKHINLKFAFALFASVFTVTSAYAEDDRVNKLEGRMGAMETKLDALIDLMTKEKSVAPSEASEQPETLAAEASPQAPVDMNPGVNLDLYSMPRLEQNDKLPISPSGFPAASAVVDGKQPFNLGAFAAIDGLSQYANPTSKTLGQLYSGHMFFHESGEYVFQASMAKREIQYTSVVDCVASVIVDGNVVATTHMQAYNFEPVSSSENGVVSLQGGVHNVGIWTICDRAGHSEQVDVEIGVKSPKDRTPKPLDASLLLVE